MHPLSGGKPPQICIPQKTSSNRLFTPIRRYTRKYFFVIFFLLFLANANAQGNFTFAGLETINFGVLDLSASSGASWGTDRLSTPGYFSAVNGATFSGSSDSYNINGYVKKYGNEAFTFPVGSGNDLRTLSISAPGSATDAYATAWIPGDPGTNTDLTTPYAGAHPVTSVSAPLVSVSSVGQWDWQVGNADNLGQGTTGSGSGLTISVSIPDMTMFGIVGDLRLAGWNGSNWVDLSGSATATGNIENSTLSGTMIPGITAIAIASVSITIAPSFSLTGINAGNCSIQLQWKASGNAGINKFIVEQSGDGATYTEAATLTAIRLPGDNNYISVVAQTQSVNYYRLKIVYDNGAIRYSTTVAFQSSCGLREKMMIYPNPVSDQSFTNLRIETAYRGNISIKLINDIGQQLTDIKTNITADVTMIKINVAPFAHGIYYVHIINSAGIRLGSVLEIIKQ